MADKREADTPRTNAVSDRFRSMDRMDAIFAHARELEREIAKRDHAYKLLLAYAECADRGKPIRVIDEILEATGCGTPETLRLKALEAAKEVG